MATSNTKRARGPRKALITAATIQRAQELIKEHREAEADLAFFTQESSGIGRVSVTCLYRTFSIVPQHFANLLAKEVIALEAEAKRLGVQLRDPPAEPVLGTAQPAQEAA